MRISATQDETWTLCPRKWWFLYPQKMPSIPKGDLDFGTVLHNVAERYLLADDTGRDRETRGPVELYPEGWDVVDDGRGEARKLSPVSTTLIRKLVTTATESGILERRPGREVEHSFKTQVIPGVTMVGKIDVLLPGEIQDHKSTKAMKWAKTPKSLPKSLQMLDYAHVVTEREPDTEVVRLRHNVFCKDPEQPVVRKVEATVTRAQVAANWNRLMRQAADMMALADAKISEEKWPEVTGPGLADACGAFGGCPFRSVCGGTETAAQYRARVTRQLSNRKNLQPVATWDDAWGRIPATTNASTSSETPTETPVDIFQKAIAAKKGQSATTEPEPQRSPFTTIDGSAPTAVAEEAPAAPATPAATDTPAPPWAWADCKACGGLGFNKVGTPCRICDSRSRKASKPTSGDFFLEPDGEGFVDWVPKDPERDIAGAEGGRSPLPGDPPAQPVAQERIEVEAPSPNDPPAEDAMQTVKEANAEAVQEAEAEAEAEAKRKAEKSKPKGAGGRPKNGYWFYIDCVPVGVETIAAESVFTHFANEFAKQQGVDSYWDLNAFARREGFARAITHEILEERWNKKHLVVRNPSGSPDLQAFVAAVVAVAPPGRVVQGLS